ncbi:hypothetical protein ABFS83_07G028400 [Erythranthe nasuta]
MSTITCQKTVSCFETQLTETTTTLKLKVAAAPPPPPPPANLDFCNWGFLQTAPNDYKESCCYTHPLSKKSSFSLELCTENLGSETGTDIITDGSSIFLSPSTTTELISPIVSDKSGGESDDDCCRQTTAVVRKGSCRETRNFPPPLSTMSGSSSMQVRRRRSDGGRLIIESVEAPFRNSYLQAERSDGRLRLCFLTAGPDHRAAETTTTTTTTTTATSAAAGEEEQEEEKRDGCGGETATAAAAAEEEAVVSKNEVVESTKKKEEFEMEMEKYQRRSRCKESGHGNNNGFCSNWKPALWVATS